eukprot:8708053-Lingulodinium_polyedra.AAC.1
MTPWLLKAHACKAPPTCGMIADARPARRAPPAVWTSSGGPRRWNVVTIPRATPLGVQAFGA